MRRFGWLGLVLYTAVTAQAASAERAEYYFLTVAGRGAPISRVALNGTPVLAGPIVSLSLPAHVTPALRSGSNTLEVEFVSDAQEGLTLTLERRRKSGPEREEVAKIAATKAESQGKRVKKAVTFAAKLPPAPKPLLLTDADREEIRRLIQAQHEALSRKDADATARLYAAAVAEARTVYPEGVLFHQKVIDEAVRKMLANPAFRMRPLRLEHLQFQAHGEAVVVERTDRQPIFESEEVDVVEEAVVMHEGKETRTQERSTTRLAPTRLFFQRAQGRWFSTLPVLML
jgi:hypothetical protein